MTVTHDLFTATYLSECFDYSAESGVLTWKVRPRSHFKTAGNHKSTNIRFAGRVAGCANSGGYLHVRVCGVLLQCHRIAWALIKQIDLADVPEEIDHIDLDTANNRETNLRPATSSQNCMNKPLQSNNTSGAKGVSWQKSSQRWHAYIKSGGVRIHLGLFVNKDDAVAARTAAQHLHGEFARLTVNDNKNTRQAEAA